MLKKQYEKAMEKLNESFDMINEAERDLREEAGALVAMLLGKPVCAYARGVLKKKAKKLEKLYKKAPNVKERWTIKRVGYDTYRATCLGAKVTWRDGMQFFRSDISFNNMNDSNWKEESDKVNYLGIEVTKCGDEFINEDGEKLFVKDCLEK